MPTQNTPQKYRREQRMPTGITPQKRLLSHPSEKHIRRGVWTLNGMALTQTDVSTTTVGIQTSECHNFMLQSDF